MYYSLINAQKRIEEEIQRTEFLSTKTKLLKRIDYDTPKRQSKVTIVGLTNVGLACAMSLLMLDATQNICCIDSDNGRMEAEANDLYHAGYFLPAPVIVTGGSDYSLSANSDICIITSQIPYESNKENILNLAEKNVELYKNIIPNLLEFNPNTILLIATEPNNIMTYVAWRLSKLPKHRVLGLGTFVDSSKFRYLISKNLDVSPNICSGWIIGDNCENNGIPVWNSVGLCGIKLKEIIPDFDTNKCNNIQQLHKLPNKIIENDRTMKKFKDTSEWGMAFACAKIVKTILSDSMSIFTLSCYAEGYMGITEKVFLSLPCLLGAKGCISILNQNLERTDVDKLKNMAKNNFDMQINLVLIKNE